MLVQVDGTNDDKTLSLSIRREFPPAMCIFDIQRQLFEGAPQLKAVRLDRVTIDGVPLRLPNDDIRTPWEECPVCESHPLRVSICGRHYPEFEYCHSVCFPKHATIGDVQERARQMMPAYKRNFILSAQVGNLRWTAPDERTSLASLHAKAKATQDKVIVCMFASPIGVFCYDWWD
jgi:hypothetical protein